MEPSNDTIMQELNALPAQFLTELPMPYVFVGYHRRLDTEIVLVTHELPEPRDTGTPLTFDGPELQALVQGIRCERFDEADFRDLCSKKIADPQWRIGLEDTITGANQVVALHISCRELLTILGLVLVAHGPWCGSSIGAFDLAHAA